MDYCEACGGDAINHPLQFTATLLNSALLPVLALLPEAKRHSKSGRFYAKLFELLARVGLGEMLERYDDKTLLLDQVLWEEARRRGIRMREFRPLHSARNTFLAELPDGSVIDFDGVPTIPGRSGAWWINDKNVMKKKFVRLGFPVAKGGVASRTSAALRVFANLPKPVVVKPRMGSASRHTTMHVHTEEELLRAFALARRICPSVTIEEEIPGDVYRPTLVDGRLIATLRRDHPCVCGDGFSSVEKLVEKANEHPARQGPYFSHLQLSPAALAELEYQGLTLMSVPAKGRKVKLHQKINWALGGTTADVTEKVHPENRALFEEVAAALGAPLVGLDFIIDDISRSWKESRSAIIECNDMPFFDNHHLPFEGEPRDVAGPLWDLVQKSH